MRTVLAVIIPWLVWGILDNVIYFGLQRLAPGAFDENAIPATTAMLLLFLALRAFYSIDAGWISSKIAPVDRKALYGCAGLLLATGLAVQALTWSAYPAWYHVAFLVSIVPCVLLGALLATRPRKASPIGPAS